MRKKTIQEELEELEREKEEHIKKMNSQTGHTDDHVYDFDAKYETHDFEEAKFHDDKDDIPESEIERMQENLRKKFEEAKKLTSGTKSSTQNSISGLGILSIILLIPFLALIGMLAGGLFLVIGLGITPITQQSTFIEVTSQVQTVEIEYDEDGDPYAKMKVMYNFEDNEYSCIVNDHSVRSMSDLPEIGDEIVLKVNPNNPNEVILPDDNYFGYIMFIIFGSFMAFMGGAGSIAIVKMFLGKK